MNTALANAPPQLNLEIKVEPLKGAALVRDYYDAAPALAPFFAGSPWDPAAWTRSAQDVRAFFDAGRLLSMSRAIRAGNESSRNKLGHICGGEGFFVQTGQQAGLFGGPLYTVHKILTTIRLAQKLETQLQVPIAPLFWTAADDHDFAEVNHSYLLTNDHELARLELRDDGSAPVSMQRRRLGADIDGVLAQLQLLLPDTQDSAQLRALLASVYHRDNTMAEAFSELIAILFERFGLLVTSSADPVVKQLAAPLIRHELQHAEAHEDAVNEQTQRLVARGYHEQVPVRSDAANVSFEDENGRDRLMRLGTDWELSRSKQRLSGSDINALLEREPERFSANVLLRPVVASAVFPTLAYVGGPAEISYFAQIGCLFAAHGVPMPLVVPRAGVEMVEYKVQKVLRKFSLTADDVHVPFDRLVSRVVRAELPAEITATFAQLRRQLTDGYGKLVEVATEIDPTLQGPLESARNASHKLLEDMDRKIVRHLKRRNAVELDQLRRASNNLYPLGAPQERVLGILSYYARYGPSILDAVAERIDFAFDRPSSEWMGVLCG
ncbi:MAG TPA: bacillithiol biosynthesis cysteine-adding enzyme BshC [Longimicrobiales bacterium]